MPFTPFHMGPGILIKALLQSSFSLMVFGWAQIIMDIQPLWVLLTGHGHLHGFSHTYMGATLLGVISALSGKYLSEFGLKRLSLSKAENPIVISWKVVFFSAFIGSYSHVFLDAMMHSDVKPYYPFSLSNDVLGLLSFTQLHQFCIYTAVVGGVLFYSVTYLRNKVKRHN